MGSAQRRTRNAVLQHGSLVLERTYLQQISAGVADVVSLESEDTLAEIAAAIFQTAPSEPIPLNKRELTLAEELRVKYASRAWTRRR
jgi:lipoate-protein ligase A